MIKILFIDSDQERLDKMIEAFKGFSQAEILKYSKNTLFKRNFEFNEWEKIPDMEKIEPEVIFRHGRDFYPDEGIKAKAKLKICYGGYEGIDPDSSEDEENIYRSIMNANYLRNHEANEILNYIEQKDKPRPDIFLPSSFDPEVEKKLADFHKDFLKKLKS